MTATRQAPAAPARVTPLAAAKLAVPPPRPALVARPQLLAQLDACRANALTILSAPAGFGKTTLLADWVATSIAAAPPAVAWLSLEPEDSQPARFWGYLLAALGRALPGLPPELGAPLLAAPPALDALVDGLSGALAARGDEAVLILDDYHTIGDLAVHRSLASLIEHAPPGLHLVLAGRADPPLPLARLRARGLLCTLRAVDLRFSDAEAAAFLRETMGLDLPPAVAAALAGYTEGWPAGLQLAALWLRDHPEAAEGDLAALADDDRYLAEFLAEEVIQHQTPELQRFLLDTAILGRLCGELCDYVTADARRPAAGAPPPIARRSDAIIEELERRNLFVVALDSHRQWFRYHNLFGDALRRQLVRRRGQAAVARLHRRAGAWFAAASAEEPALLDEALRHALAGKAHDLAADLIAPRADLLGAQGQVEQLLAWLAALPEAALVARPALALRYAWMLFLHGRQDEAARWLGRAEAAIAGRPEPDPLTAALPEVIRAAMATTRHDAAAVLRHVERAAPLLPLDDPFWWSTLDIARGLALQLRGDAREAAEALQRAADQSARAGNSYGVMVACWHLARTRVSQGRLDDAARALAQIAADGSMAYAGCRDVGLAEVAYARGELAAARALAAGGLDALEAGAGQPRVIVGACALLARICADEADVAAAAAWLDRGEALARRLELREELRQLLADRAVLAAAAGDLAAAAAWAGESGLDPAEPDACHEHELRALALVLGAGGDARALPLAAAMLAAAEAQGRAGDRHAWEQIRAGLGGQRAQAEAQRLARADAAHAGRLIDGAYERLSERELRVLALIGAGCSNQEIADALIVSLNTIKTHIKRIYEKLQVSSRVGAVERARELGLYS